jgi:hypothetical protein
MNDVDELRAGLAEALAGRPGWTEWNQMWRHTEFSGPGETHTVRHLYVQTLGGGRGEVRAVKDNALGQPCDVAEFTDVAAAVAWVETPRSEGTVQHRAFMAQMDAYARRDDVDLAGLKGVKTDSGLNPKRQHYDVIQFDAPVGQVRITALGHDRWRISRNRKNTTITAAGDRPTVHAALRAEINRLATAQEGDALAKASAPNITELTTQNGDLS